MTRNMATAHNMHNKHGVLRDNIGNAVLLLKTLELPGGDGVDEQ